MFCMYKEIIKDYHQGQCLEVYDLFGSHFNKDGSVTFRVWAPEAIQVSVIGEFNDWDLKKHIMHRMDDDGSIWEITIQGLKEFQMYKYALMTKWGTICERSDPYAFFSELRPGTASKLYDIDGYQWEDQYWMDTRTRNFDKPLNIYEAHLGSWKLKDEEEENFYSYEEMIHEIIPYMKKMGYTHLELMPLQEHPFDGSWGYQVTGYFSATSRYGQPKQLMHFIDCCHKEGIGVIMDFVPAHFVKDTHGLFEFDGSRLYGYPDDYRRYSEWDTIYFDLGREEIRSFMMSNVNFWATYFHMDGVRFDAVSNLIFWKGNKNNGINDGAIDFMKRMNYCIHEKHPSMMTIAEDSSDFPNVTKSTLDGGLGFDYKWDLGWMNDTLKYMGRDPVYRKYHHNDFTFSMAYFYSERFILPFSHDEVVHGKGTIIDKIFGDFDMKFAQLKTLYVYMMSHPGKKLNFMGNELAEFKEWDEKKALGWNILEYPAHEGFHRYTKALNHLYLSNKALYKKDYEFDGFKWMMVDNAEQSLFAYVREAENNLLLFVLNFTPVVHKGVKIPVPVYGEYKEIFNSDQNTYGGQGVENKIILKSSLERCINELQYISVDIGSFASAVFTLNKKLTPPVVVKRDKAKRSEHIKEL